jgi:hypothetical protein
MTYEMVYQRLCVIRDKNYADPADFANDVLSLMASFERKQAAEQSAHPTSETLPDLEASHYAEAECTSWKES